MMTDSNGNDIAFSGEYLEIDAPTRMKQTWSFEPIPGADSVETMTLDDHGAITRMVVHVKHTSKENLEGHLASGMEAGMRETYERLDELLATPGQ